MNLSEDQLKPLWRLMAEAWARHCALGGDRVSDSAAKAAWRRALLLRETGFESLTKLPRSGRHYVTFMAALEVIAENGVRWQLKLYGADQRPYLHAIEELMEQYDLSLDYVNGIIRRVLKSDVVPSLLKLDVEQLAHILAAIKRTCTSLTREVAA